MTQLSNVTLSTTVRNFPETKWTEISSRVAEAFRLSARETQILTNGAVPKLIAALPFLAGCEDADRTAVAHLGTFLLSVRETKSYFNASPEDSENLTERLRLIADFKCGDQAIIDRGMNLLALNMISDYRRDAEEDVFLRKYNPVSAGDFDYEAACAELTERIERVECPEMDQIMTLSTAPLTFWWAT